LQRLGPTATLRLRKGLGNERHSTPSGAMRRARRGVEGERVWMTCTCGAVINRALEPVALRPFVRLAAVRPSLSAIYENGSPCQGTSVYPLLSSRR
jgi:hypothetical protein